MWKVFILALIVISSSTNARIINHMPELSLDDIKGLWVGDIPSQVFTGFDIKTGKPTYFGCANELYQECINSLSPGRAYIELGLTEEHEYHAYYYRFKNAETLEESKLNYPICYMENRPPSLGPIETFATLVSYDHQQLKFELKNGLTACMPWQIFVEDGLVKAYVEQKCDWEGNPLDILIGAPFECTNRVVECHIDFSDFKYAYMKFTDYYIAVCTHGDCLKITEKLGAHQSINAT